MRATDSALETTSEANYGHYKSKLSWITKANLLIKANTMVTMQLGFALPSYISLPQLSTVCLRSLLAPATFNGHPQPFRVSVMYLLSLRGN